MSEPTAGPVLHLVLADSAVELVPQALWSHPSVSRSAKKRGKRPGDILLEDSYHHSAMREATKAHRFEEAERRGRPDIMHTSLLVALESRLNREGRLRIWVHTRDDKVISVRPDTRLQRAQHRFYGLLEDLFASGSVPRGQPDPLLSLREGIPLRRLLEEIAPDRVVLFDEAGDTGPLEDALTVAPRIGTVAAVVGGFPTGPFRSDLEGLPGPVQKVALGREPLAAWTVVSELVVRADRAFNDDGGHIR